MSAHSDSGNRHNRIICDQINQPKHDDKLCHAIQEFTRSILDPCNRLSPQMNAKLSRLSEAAKSKSSSNIVRCLSSIMNRLMLELVQAHSSTKQREHDFRSLLNKKGCLLDPILIKWVIDELINLYQSAAKHCSECSFTRKVLILYLLKTFDNKFREKQIAETIQTLYRSSCFEVIDGKFKLKDGISTADHVRAHVNREMIKLGLENHIRMDCESWSFILYGIYECQNNISQIQSLLDKIETPVKIGELKDVIRTKNDNLNLEDNLSELDSISNQLNLLNHNPSTLTDDEICVLIKRFTRLRRLFVLRQTRSVHV